MSQYWEYEYVQLKNLSYKYNVNLWTLKILLKYAMLQKLLRKEEESDFSSRLWACDQPSDINNLIHD